ncbi:MAG: hypothetical protein C0506_13740 [Anaerolinea sp.]|nr:hypothetical protein [Anaerolinea sp.]
MMNVTSGLQMGAQSVHVETVRKTRPVVPVLVGPVVVAVRGPSRSGKTALVERLIEVGRGRGWKVAWVKRTHHQVDLPEKASGRVWSSAPAAMVLHANDRVQVTLPAAPAETGRELSYVPAGMDLVLLETHTPERFPTLLSDQLQPADGEHVIGRFELYGNVEAAAAAIPVIAGFMPVDARFDAFLRAALALHGGHGCAGLVLGTRLAMAGAGALGIDVPDRDKRLTVVSETDRCALDGIQAVTGCRLSKRSLRLLDYGKVAATFIDEWTGSTVRVSVRGDLRERVGAGVDADGRHAMQRQAYGTWPVDELLDIRPSTLVLSEFEKPGKPRRRVLCGDCGEEVSDGREIETDSGARCRPCAAARHLEG